MQHLDPERLAAFDHDAPSAGELAHLASCALCRGERDAFSALATIPMRAAVPRLTEWDALAVALRADGLLTSATTTVATKAPSRDDTTVRSSDVYRARLAALDQMMTASRAALRDAPQDPVLNHYYLAAYTAREATLQQLGGTLPVDKTIEGY